MKLKLKRFVKAVRSSSSASSKLSDPTSSRSRQPRKGWSMKSSNESQVKVQASRSVIRSLEANSAPTPQSQAASEPKVKRTTSFKMPLMTLGTVSLSELLEEKQV